MEVEFYKYHGTGNDFIIVDGFKTVIQPSQAQIEKWCDRRFGIGADGFILLNRHPMYDFEMVYFNADGFQGSMCGNGGRCIVHFAFKAGYIQPFCRFLASDGLHEAKILENDFISLHMQDVNEMKRINGDFFIDTGSPHYIKYITNLKEYDVFHEGQSIRNSPNYKETGTNVNFVEWENNRLFVRTYERGVEDETYSCGTGVTAAALVAASQKQMDNINRIQITTKGGDLSVAFKRNDNGFSDIWLEGPATFVFKGTLKL